MYTVYILFYINELTAKRKRYSQDQRKLKEKIITLINNYSKNVTRLLVDRLITGTGLLWVEMKVNC